MARRRRQVGSSARGPVRGQQARRPSRQPKRRSRSFMARANERSVALVVLSVAGIAIAGVAIAGAVSSSGGNSTVTPTAASTPSVSLPPKTSSPSPSVSPVAVKPTPTPSSRPTPKPTASPRATPPPVVHSASPSATSSPCPPAAQRVAAARRLLQHQSALPQVTLITAGPRDGLLGNSDASARTLTLYVRSCAEESTIRLAFVWAYEAGQFIPVQTWDASTTSRWEQLRGAGSLSSIQLKQDAASVYAFWQTGSTQYWQSPVAPPSAAQLSQLVPFLHMS